MFYKSETIMAAIEKFLTDDNLKRAINWQKEISIFNICKISEPKHSAFLSWLLDPNQAHGLGDLVIKELLKMCTTTYNTIKKKNKVWAKTLSENQFYEDFSVYKIDATSFMNTTVQTEFKAGENSRIKKQSAVDICLLNRDNDLLVFIENKYGAKLSKGQLEKYYHYLSKTYNEDDFYVLYIFLDANFEQQEEINIDIDPNWINLNYDWIIHLLKSVLERHILTKQVRKTIRDYYIEISDNYEIEGYYSDCLKAIRKLSSENRNLVNIYENFCPDEYPNRTVTDLLFEESIVLKDASKMLYDIYQKYCAIIDEMISYSDFDLIEESILKKTGLSDDQFDIKKNFLFFTTPKLAEANKEENWPIYVRYHKNRKGQDDEKKEDTVSIDFDSSFLPEEKFDDIIKVAEEISNRHIEIKSNKKYLRILSEKIPTDTPIQEIVEKLTDLYTKLERFHTFFSE